MLRLRRPAEHLDIRLALRADKEARMSTRRVFLAGVGTLLGGVTMVRAQDNCTIFTKEMQSATTPEQALARLKDGNARFVANRPVHCDLTTQVKESAGGQAPFAAILGCMDSRAPPELVFDQRLGDIFAVRIAGNFANPDIIGSLEFATEVAGAKLIAVLAHTDCGAVKGAIDDVHLGNLTGTLANIRPAVASAAKVAGAHDSSDANFVRTVTERNAQRAAAMLTTRSSVLAGLVSKGKLQIACAMHDVGTGAVAWLETGLVADD